MAKLLLTILIKIKLKIINNYAHYVILSSERIQEIDIDKELWIGQQFLLSKGVHSHL